LKLTGLIFLSIRFLFEGVWREKRQNDVDFPLRYVIAANL